MMRRKKHNGPDNSAATHTSSPSTNQAHTTTTEQVQAAPIAGEIQRRRCPSLIKHTLTSLLLAAAPSTTTAAPVALQGPPPSQPPNATRDVTEAVHTKPTVPESQIYDPAKPVRAQTAELHPTNQAAPVLSATSGPLDNNPAVEYTETVNSSNNAHTLYSEHEAVEDPPFATPMEAPESASFGQVAYAAVAEKGTKTT